MCIFHLRDIQVVVISHITFGLRQCRILLNTHFVCRSVMIMLFKDTEVVIIVRLISNLGMTEHADVWILFDC